jgi:hypothetical protein
MHPRAEGRKALEGGRPMREGRFEKTNPIQTNPCEGSFSPSQGWPLKKRTQFVAAPLARGYVKGLEGDLKKTNPIHHIMLCWKLLHNATVLISNGLKAILPRC